MASVPVPPAMDAQLRGRVQALAREVEDLVAPGEQSSTACAQVESSELRQERFETLRALVLSVTRSQAWCDDALARELLLTLEELQDAIDADPHATDPEWKQREALMRLRVVTRAMVRQIEHRELDRPEAAAHYVATELEDVGDARVARLLGTTARMVGKYREGVAEIRKDPDRISLVGQLVRELSGTMTPRGAALWFEAPRETLGGRSALDVIGEDAGTARESLLTLARGGRGQLDVGGAELA